MEKCTCRLARKNFKINPRRNAISGYREQVPKAIEAGLVNYVRARDVGEADPTFANKQTGVYQTVGIDCQSEPREPEVNEEQCNDSGSSQSSGISVAAQCHRQCDSKDETDANRENDVAAPACAI